MNKNKTKFFTIGLVAAAMIIMTAFSVSAKSRRLTPADNCSVANNDPDLYISRYSYVYASTGAGYAVCGIPNDTYMSNTEINQINAHFYNSSTDSSTISANVCTIEFNGNVTDCEGSLSTSTVGETMISWTGVTLDAYADATYLYAYLNKYDKLRLIWVTE